MTDILSLPKAAQTDRIREYAEGTRDFRSWTCVASAPNFVSLDLHPDSQKLGSLLQAEDTWAKPNRWRSGHFFVSVKTMPSMKVIGVPGLLNFHSAVFDCVLLGVSVERAYQVQRHTNGQSMYTPGMLSKKIQVLILEDRNPSPEPGTMKFFWEGI